MARAGVEEKHLPLRSLVLHDLESTRNYSPSCYELFTGDAGEARERVEQLFLASKPYTEYVHGDLYLYNVKPSFAHLLPEGTLKLNTVACVDTRRKVYSVYEPLYLPLLSSGGERITPRQLVDYINYVYSIVVHRVEEAEEAALSDEEFARRLAAELNAAIQREFRSTAYADIIRYYVLRKLIGYDILDPLLADKGHIEDIVVPGSGVEVKVSAKIPVRRDGELRWETHQLIVPARFPELMLNQLIEKLVMRSGAMISMLNPLASRMLMPHHHRVTVSYGREVSVNGPVLVVRLFPEKPWNPIRLLYAGGAHPLLLALVGAAVQFRLSFIVAGVMGSGKTSLLNTLIPFIRQDATIVTIEDTPELRIPHKYWIRHVTREAYGQGEATGAITMFDLMKHALRESADYVIIGEVRGEEGRIWAQAIATGHGGLTTFHAENPRTVIARLTTDPIRVEPSLLYALHGIVMMEKDVQTRRRVAKSFHEVATRQEGARIENVPRRLLELRMLPRHQPLASEALRAKAREAYMLVLHNPYSRREHLRAPETLVVLEGGSVRVAVPRLSGVDWEYVEARDAREVMSVLRENAKTLRARLGELLGEAERDESYGMLRALVDLGVAERYLEGVVNAYLGLEALNISLARLRYASHAIQERLEDVGYCEAATLVWRILGEPGYPAKLASRLLENLEDEASLVETLLGELREAHSAYSVWLTPECAGGS